MRNDYNLMTVDEYVKSLKNNEVELNDNSMMTAEDYAKSLRNQCVKFQASSLMTVNDFVKSLDEEEYLAAGDRAIAEKVEQSIKANKQNAKAEIEAEKLEDLLG